MVKTISTLGSHSALDVCDGAKAEGFETIVVTQKGRDRTYSEHYRTRERNGEEIGIVDQTINLDKFSQICDDKNQKKLENSVFVPNRSFAVYVGYDKIEKEFKVPVFGNKFMLRAEERDAPKNQYELMKKAGIRFPKEIVSPDKIDRWCIVKVNEAKRTYERAFFIARNENDFITQSEKMIKEGRINRKDLDKAKIEEYVIGAYFNLNFFYSPIHQELELLGIDFRRQTNLDGFLRIPSDIQDEILKFQRPSTIEVGHVACTLRESLLDSAFELGEKFVQSSQKEYSKSGGIKGPFALQCAITEEGKEEFVCFDISMRMPGSPGTRFTPYPEYLHRRSISFGRRVAMEIKEAQKLGKIDDVTT
jgi:5-formaminoimidazole-4-carboxamide-1-(beta)-D-ribofuranosyl 5'-monophosphate synthetase